MWEGSSNEFLYNTDNQLFKKLKDFALRTKRFRLINKNNLLKTKLRAMIIFY